MPTPESAAPLDHHQARSTPAGTEPELHQVFRAAAKLSASDVHLKAGSPPRLRIGPELRTSGSAPLTAAALAKAIAEILTPEQQAYLHREGTVDLAHSVEPTIRFRVNVFRQRGELALVARRVPAEIPTFTDLGLPPVVARLADSLHQGLVLVAGQTGSGKSTTLAAMLEHINQARAAHILTIEDPIEFLYVDKKAQVCQREVGLDTPSFEHALRTLMREDPDVVLIGELRDRETFQAALRAAETGHLVLGSVHASSAGQTIVRVLDLFPPDERDVIRQVLAFNLQAIVCQVLVPSPRAALGRLPACEVLVNNAVTRKYILEKRENDLLEVIRRHAQEGMVDFNESLRQLVLAQRVDHRTAYEYSPNAEELKMRLKGITTF